MAFDPDYLFRNVGSLCKKGDLLGKSGLINLHLFEHIADLVGQPFPVCFNQLGGTYLHVIHVAVQPVKPFDKVFFYGITLFDSHLVQGIKAHG